MEHFALEIANLQTAIETEKARLKETIRRDEPFWMTKRIMDDIRLLESKLALTKAELKNARGLNGDGQLPPGNES